ncbi:MAG: metallophosphoesterase family protein [Spirochaetota bacterium]
MRILHTSDWHLGKRLDLFSRIEEQRQVMDEIVRAADEYQVDAVLLSGDLFDTFNPSTEAQELFYSGLKRLSKNGARPVIAIAGNHDSADAIQAPDPLARLHGIVLVGYFGISLPRTVTDAGVTISFPAAGVLRIERAGQPALNILVSPYANERRMQQEIRKLSEGPGEPAAPASEAEFIERLSGLWKRAAAEGFRPGDVNLFAGHLFAIGSAAGSEELQRDDLQEPEDEKPILYKGGLPPIPVSALPEGVQYAALGHLHRCHFISETAPTAAYSGSPLAYSRSESEQTKYVLIVEAEPGGGAEVKRIAMQGGLPIMRPVCSSVTAALEWLAAHQTAYVELTLKLEDYLSSEDRRKIYAAHERILSIIPEIAAADPAADRRPADISKSIEELFSDYYANEHQGARPPQQLTELFREVLSSTEASE